MTLARPVVIFDVDGTLCETTAVDDECFLRACEEFFGIRLEELDWSLAEDVTDAGVLDWFRRQLGRGPLTSAELARVASRFLGLLEGAHGRCPSLFEPKAGASHLLPSLLRVSRVGIATGGFGQTARFKLRVAGLPDDLLLASSDDSKSRVKIFSLAAERLRREGAPPSKVTLVGDGVWDVRVAGELGWAFVGIGEGKRAQTLREAGASEVVSDFRDVERLTRLLA